MNPIINNIAKLMNVPILNRTETFQRYTLTAFEKRLINTFDGSYCIENDAICIGDNLSVDKQEFTTLHEIGHATGHKSRLNRISIYDYRTMRYTEEMLADNVALKLSKLLKLDDATVLECQLHLSLLEKRYGDLVSRDYLNEQTELAVNYIMDLISVKKAA